MGKNEEIARKRIRNSRIHKAVLSTLVISGGVLMGAAPSPAALAKAISSQKQQKVQRNSAYYSVKRLRQAGLVEFQKTEHGWCLRITESGKQQLHLLETETYEPKKPKRWDKRWRILIFDIKEHKRPVRDKLRAMLVATGFEQLQKSVWVYPYPCEELVELMKADLKTGREILYIVADVIENEEQLKKDFGLK